MNSFLTKLRKLNIELTVVESKLKINAPKGVLTKEILAEIQENKVAIISYLEGIRSSQKKYETIGKAIQKDSYPLSPAQQRLYFLYQFDKKSTVYNISFAYLVKGPIDIGKLTDAFNSLIDRHEILRTSFQLIDEDVRQIVHEKISCEVEIISKGEESQSQLNATFIQPFDLSIAPLVRIGVVEIKKDENILIFDIHHIIFDGISQEVFVKEFMSLYEGEKLSPVPLQYKDYIEWLETAGQQSAIQRQRAFWLDNFIDIPPKADLPSDYERPAVKKFTGDVISLNLDKEETRRLEELAKKAGVTLNVILFSVYHILLRKLTQQKDIVIGTPVAGRPHPDLSNLMGVFINMLPIRLSLEDDLSIKACISQIKAKFLKALDNQSFQFEELINELQVERDSSRNPLFDFMFAFQNFERPKVELPGLTLEPYPLQNKVSRFDLTLWTYKKGEEINLSFEYSTELFQRDTILRYGNYFKRILRLAQENWDTKIAEI
ncbi:MAG: condensation domain-containing protein, partial [Bacteroidota bacterium]